MSSLGISGDPIMVMINGVLRQRYPPEEEAAALIRNPAAPRFIPAPEHRGMLWCPGHRDYEHLDRFSADPKRPTGKRGYCKECERRKEKERRAKKSRKPEHWYRI
jgi:hypothetical protein